MRAQLHHGGAGAAHVKYLDIRAVLVECTHVVGVAWVERDAQQRRRWRSAGRRLVLWRRRLVEDGAVFEAPQVECAQRAVRADRHEDVRRVGQPRHVVHLTIVRDQLRHRRRRVQIPDRTRGINRGCDHKTRNLLIPRKIGQRRPTALALYFRLLQKYWRVGSYAYRREREKNVPPIKRLLGRGGVRPNSVVAQRRKKTRWVRRSNTQTHVRNRLLWREARSLAPFETTRSSTRSQAATEAPWRGTHDSRQRGSQSQGSRHNRPPPRLDRPANRQLRSCCGNPP